MATEAETLYPPPLTTACLTRTPKRSLKTMHNFVQGPAAAFSANGVIQTAAPMIGDKH